MAWSSPANILPGLVAIGLALHGLPDGASARASRGFDAVAVGFLGFSRRFGAAGRP